MKHTKKRLHNTSELQLIVLVVFVVLFAAGGLYSLVKSRAQMSVAGDTNGDNVVDALDLSMLKNNFGAVGAVQSQGDVNGDGLVNSADLSIMISHWHTKY